MESVAMEAMLEIRHQAETADAVTVRRLASDLSTILRSHAVPTQSGEPALLAVEARLRTLTDGSPSLRDSEALLRASLDIAVARSLWRAQNPTVIMVHPQDGGDACARLRSEVDATADASGIAQRTLLDIYVPDELLCAVVSEMGADPRDAQTLWVCTDGPTPRAGEVHTTTPASDRIFVRPFGPR